MIEVPQTDGKINIKRKRPQIRCQLGDFGGTPPASEAPCAVPTLVPDGLHCGSVIVPVAVMTTAQELAEAVSQ